MFNQSVKSMKSLFFVSILLIITYNLYAQNPEGPRLIQFTGRVFNEYLQPLKYAHIMIINKRKGGITDREGKFSIVVNENDSIHFSSMGFKHAVVVIPDTLDSPFFIRDVLMRSDTFAIPEVEVYPWNDYDEFKEAFLNLELPEDDLDRARKNIALIKTQMIIENNPSASGNFNQIMQKEFNNLSYRGMTPTYQIFNVFAWRKFIKALKNGDFKNHSND